MVVSALEAGPVGSTTESAAPRHNTVAIRAHDAVATAGFNHGHQNFRHREGSAHPHPQPATGSVDVTAAQAHTHAITAPSHGLPRALTQSRPFINLDNRGSQPAKHQAPLTHDYRFEVPDHAHTPYADR